MIGLVDYDFQRSTSINLTYPNLEIMKLATYYKFENNTFCRLVDLKEEELEAYDKIYFFSENNGAPEVPLNFRRAKNIIYGGTAFTNGVYYPFENSVIDYTIPRPAIYKEFLKEKYNEGIKTKVINQILDNTYYRCYAGKDKLPRPAIKPKKQIILYDKDFFYPDWQDIIKDISNHKPATIIRVHPIICKTLEQYITMRSFPKLARANEIILDLDIPLSEVNYMFKKYKNYFLADINFSSNVYLSLGGNFKSNFQYYKDFIYKMNLLYAFWSNKIPVKLYYITPDIGIQDILQPISIIAHTWSKNFSMKKTLRERINFKAHFLEQEAYNQLIKFYPTANDLFDQNYNKLVERGYWRL